MTAARKRAGWFQESKNKQTNKQTNKKCGMQMLNKGNGGRA